MNARYLLTAYIAVAAVFFAACDQVINLDLPADNERLVVNSIMNPDSNLQVYVSKSQFILDNAPLAGIIDAEIKVYDGELLVETITENLAGFYKSSVFKPEIGKNYRVEVSAPKFETVDASTDVPDHITILSIDTARVRVEGFEQMQVKIKFNDNISTRDYYAIELGQTYLEFVYDDNWEIVDTLYTFYASYIQLGGGLGSDLYGTTLPFNDEFLVGETPEITILADAYIFTPNDWVGDEIVINLKKITKDYYNYITSYSKYQSVNGDPFAQPVKVFSNINKGYGILGASTTSTDTLFLK